MALLFACRERSREETGVTRCEGKALSSAPGPLGDFAGKVLMQMPPPPPMTQAVLFITPFNGNQPRVLPSVSVVKNGTNHSHTLAASS